MSELSREQALKELETAHGISGEQIYLLPVVPLIEMLWADGVNQGDEVLLVYDFVSKHIALINTLADGQEVLDMAQAKTFLDPMIEDYPPEGLLRALRALANEVVFDYSDETSKQEMRERILDYCMDIAAAAVTHYPYNKRDRFVAEEKILLRELCEELG